MYLPDIVNTINAVFGDDITNCYFSNEAKKSSVTFEFDQEYDLKGNASEILSTIKNNAAGDDDYSIEFDYEIFSVTVENNE